MVDIKLGCGDCLKWMNYISDNSIDMILCDLPYGTTQCKWDVIIEFESLWKQYKRIMKKDCAIVLNATQPFTSLLVCSNLTMFKHEWIWDKITARGHLVAKKRPMAQHENIVVFGNSKIKYNPQMIDRPVDKIEIRKTTEYARTDIMGGDKTNAPVNKIYDQWYPKTIIDNEVLNIPDKIISSIIVESNASSSVKSIHPTQKPVALCEYLIKTYSNENDTVLDNCMGSGSTGIACINTNRNFFGIEKDENYFKMAYDRICEHQRNIGEKNE